MEDWGCDGYLEKRAEMGIGTLKNSFRDREQKQRHEGIPYPAVMSVTALAGSKIFNLRIRYACFNTNIKPDRNVKQTL